MALFANTIKLYLSGVQHCRSLQNPGSLSIFAAHPLKVMLRGIQRTQGRSHSSCQPITDQIFHDNLDLLSPAPYGAGPNLVLKAAIYLSFFGFLRSQANCHAPVLLKGCLTRIPYIPVQLSNNKNRKTGQGFVVKYYRTKQ